MIQESWRWNIAAASREKEEQSQWVAGRIAGLQESDPTHELYVWHP